MMHVTPLKILIVGDNGANAPGTRRLLVQAGHAARVAGNGTEAINTLNSVYFDLVLVDIEGGGVNGIKTTRAIREMDDGIANIPIIGLSGAPDPLTATRCRKAGMNEFLAKPFSLQDFSDTLRKIHNRRIFQQTS